ncbi:MAG: phosphoribosylformylglycinamidine synthase subunit PurQ [Myxococcaceae bacterium]|nr:MAG: phosphoribosylformylglycinamidine synthase subunit PurQ [Myxococcaceae bacterium]
MKVGIVVFPGSNCDEDAFHAAGQVLGHQPQMLWHKDHDLRGSELIILPGGFSYGDYLRCGAIARFAPVMEEVAAFAKKGGPVIGICNGFQILTEAGLLPGALLQNANRQYICQDVVLRTEKARTRFASELTPGETFRIPIAHGDGNYFIDDEGLKRLEGEGQVVFRYLQNPNGSRADIAGIVNSSGNVLGMMPHPERNAEPLLGNADGRRVLASFLH